VLFLSARSPRIGYGVLNIKKLRVKADFSEIVPTFPALSLLVYIYDFLQKVDVLVQEEVSKVFNFFGRSSGNEPECKDAQFLIEVQRVRKPKDLPRALVLAKILSFS
jgi:hypothetical protein